MAVALKMIEVKNSKHPFQYRYMPESTQDETARLLITLITHERARNNSQDRTAN